MSGRPLLLIITALAASGIQAYPSQCWSDNSAIDCKDDCLDYLAFVNKNADTLFTVDNLCCTYAETSASDTTVAHAGCIICNADGGNAYCPAGGSPYNCFIECTTDDCNDPGTLSGASGTCVATVDTCPFEVSMFMPINQVCATGNAACMTDYGEILDSMGAECYDEGDPPVLCTDVVADYCAYMCMSSTSSISALQADGKTFKDVPITFLKIGDMVESRDKHNTQIAAKITALPHGPATGEFVEVATSNKHSVKVTPHHTFPACGGGEVQAHELKAGDCLHTADGERKVKHATKVPATGETYTIEVEHGKVVMADGILTHARHAGMLKLKAANSSTA